MKHYLVTIETSYSTEDYLIPVLDGESIGDATEKALSDIAFCEDYKIIGCRKVGLNYLKAVSLAQKAYLNLTNDSVPETFTSGRYSTYENIIAEIAEIKEGRKQNNDKCRISENVN